MFEDKILKFLRFLEKNKNSWKVAHEESSIFGTEERRQEIFGLISEAHQLAQENRRLRAQISKMEEEIPEPMRWENWLFAKLQRVMITQGDEYLELTDSSQGEAWIVTFHKKFGKSPTQELEILKNQNQKLKNQNFHLQVLTGRLNESRKDIEAELMVQKKLLKIAFEKDRDFHKEFMHKLIENVQQLIYNWNVSFYKQHHFNELHESFFDGYRTLNQKLSFANLKWKKIQLELINSKITHFSTISKNRKRQLTKRRERLSWRRK